MKGKQYHIIVYRDLLCMRTDKDNSMVLMKSSILGESDVPNQLISLSYTFTV